MNFFIVGENTKIEIEVFTQSYPESTDYWDGNWLNATIECEIPGFNAKFDLHIRTDELQDFSDQVKEMARKKAGKAALYNLDGYIEIEAIYEEPGTVNWTAALCYPAGNGASLKFDFSADQTSLNQLIKELDEIISVFPVVGAP